MRFLSLPGAALVAVLALHAGCAKSPVANVSAMEATLAASGMTAAAYVQQPACDGANGPHCADPTLKAQIKVAFDTAYNAVTAAQVIADAGGTPDLTAANSSLASLQALIVAIPK